MDQTNILLLLCFFSVLYLFFLRPQSQKKKEQEDFMKNLKKGDSVVTIGGLCGIIYQINDKKFIIETHDHSKLEFLKNYISIEETMNANKKENKEK